MAYVRGALRLFLLLAAMAEPDGQHGDGVDDKGGQGNDEAALLQGQVEKQEKSTQHTHGMQHDSQGGGKPIRATHEARNREAQRKREDQQEILDGGGIFISGKEKE